MRKIGLFNIGKLGLVKSAGKAKTDISKVIEKWVKEHMVFWYDMSKPVDTYSQNFNDWRSHPSVNADIIITSTSFVNTYEFVGSMARGEGYITKNFKNSLIGEVKGSNLHTGECHYNWFTGNAGSGKIGRRGVSFGGRSDYDNCSLRLGSADAAPSLAVTYLGGGFRCTITQP